MTMGLDEFHHGLSSPTSIAEDVSLNLPGKPDSKERTCKCARWPIAKAPRSSTPIDKLIFSLQQFIIFSSLIFPHIFTVSSNFCQRFANVCLSFDLCSLSLFFFLGRHLRHMEVPRLGVESELLLAYTTAAAMLDQSPLQPTLQLAATLDA